MSITVAVFDKQEARGRLTRGGRPAWSTALRSGRSPYRFAGSNPAPRITNLKGLNLVGDNQHRFEFCPPRIIKQLQNENNDEKS